jgi:hypothetical protein
VTRLREVLLTLCMGGCVGLLFAGAWCIVAAHRLRNRDAPMTRDEWRRKP